MKTMLSPEQVLKNTGIPEEKLQNLPWFDYGNLLTWIEEAQKAAVVYTLDQVNMLQKTKFNCGETGYLDTESREILKDEIFKTIQS